MTTVNERALEILAEAVRIRDEAKEAILARSRGTAQEAKPTSRRGCVSKPITYRRCRECGQTFEDRGLWRHQDETHHYGYDMYKVYVDLGASDA